MTTKIMVIMLALFFSAVTAVFADTVQLPQTGQTKCYNAAGTQITCSGTGQDGEFLAGISWPKPRFVENGSCITDDLTGLMWTRNANLPNEKKTWQAALDYVSSLNSGGGICGYTDWRLPNINELESLANLEESILSTWLNTQGFINVQPNYYWTSSTQVKDTGSAWFVGMSSGGVYLDSKLHDSYVWTVRSGQAGPSGNSVIWETGQTTKYAAGDDGDLQKGAVWPDPRFTDNNDETVTDNLTGLMWTKDANTPGPSACSPGTFKVWQAALDFIQCLNVNSYLGHNDWRLPNRKELYSLVDHSKDSPSIPANNPFNNVRSDTYWSSSTYAFYTGYAWNVSMFNGSVDYNGKSSVDFVWPVRSGQSGSSGNQSCNYTIFPTQKTFSYKVASGSVTIIASDKSCTWTAISNDPWITIKSGISGSGKNRKTAYSIMANTSSTQRTGTMNIAGQTFTVTQAGTPCIFKISPSQSTTVIASVGGSESFDVTATPVDCTWTAAVDNKASWITIDLGDSWTGSGTVNFTAAANSSTPKKARTGKINILGSDGKVKKAFTVRQSK